MKRLIKLTLSLLGITGVSSTAIACNTTILDSNLDIIKKGSRKYEIQELISNKEKPEIIKEISLNDEEIKTLSKTIVQKELEKNDKAKNAVTWYDETLSSNEKCYNFTINNGEIKKEKIRTWKVREDTQQFTINISYQVGFVNEDKKFVDQQKIDMSYDIKAGISKSEKMVNEWINDFNNKITKISVNLNSDDIKLLEEGSAWSKLSSKIKDQTKKEIIKQLENEKLNPNQNFTWNIKDDNNNKVKDKEIKIAIIVNSTDVEKTTKEFTVEFN